MKNVLNAINEVRKVTGTVTKNGKNTHFNYKYAMAADVIEHVREAMNEQGLVVWPKTVKDIANIKGDTVQEATMVYVVAHTESGESIEVEIRAAGEDKGDKKPYKMGTGALKYLLINLFLIGTDDDPENDSKGRQASQGNNSQGANKGAQRAPQGEADTRPWLNKGTDNYNKTVDKIKAGTVTVAIVEKHYKLNKEIKAELEALVPKRQTLK